MTADLQTTMNTPPDDPVPALDALIELHQAILQVMYSDLAAARCLTDDVWAIARRFPDAALLQAQAHWSQGSALLPIPDYARALDHYDQALVWFEYARRELAPAEPTRDVRIVQIPRVFCLSELGRYQEAEQAAVSAEEWLADHPNDDARLVLLINRSQLASTMGRYDQVIALADATIKLASARERPAEAAMAWVNRGHACIYLGRFDEADDALERGIAAATQAGEPLTAARALWNRARLLRCRGRLFDALRTLREAQRGLAQAENETPALAMEEAAIAAQLYQLDAARHAALRAAGAFVQQQMPAYSANAALFAARLALQQNKLGKAGHALHHALEQADHGLPQKLQAEITLVQAQFIAASTSGMADMAHAAQRRAHRLAVEAVQLLDRSGLVQEAALGELTVAALDMLLDEHAAAITRYQHLTHSPYPYLQIAANDRLGDLLPAAEALPHLRRAADLAVVQRRLLPVEELQARYSSETSIYHMRLAACYLELGQIGQAFESICIAKAGPLLDLRAAVADLDDTVRIELELDKAEIARWREQFLHHEHEYWRAVQHGRRKSEAYHEQRRREAEARIQHSEEALTRKMNTVGGRGGMAPVPLLDDVQRMLSPRQMLLEYARLGDDLVCFLIRSDQPISIRNLGPLTTLQRSFRRWELVQHGLMAGTIAMNVHQHIESGIAPLREALYAPLAGDLYGITDLLIAPIDFLHHLPWLLLFERTLSPLTLTPCGAMWAVQLDWADAPTSPPCLLGYAGRGQRLLPNVALELEAIHRCLPAAQMVLNATATDLCISPPPELLHVAAHCTTSPDNPLASTLELADSSLTLLEAHRLNLRGTRFVALSACATGERPRHGDMALALAGAFLCAGARAVLASLWPVDDTATRLLMEHFYAVLADGAAPAIALHVAQHLIRDAYPLDWAAFQLWAGAAI